MIPDDKRRSATDRFAGLGAAFLPFVFLAKHDTQEVVKELFEKTWNENVGGARTVLLYLEEIATLAMVHMGSARWAVKHAAALSIADAATSNAREMTPRQQEVIWPALDRALVGKSWDGKERVLSAYVDFARDSAELQQNHPEIRDRIKQVRWPLLSARRLSSHVAPMAESSTYTEPLLLSLVR